MGYLLRICWGIEKRVEIDEYCYVKKRVGNLGKRGLKRFPRWICAATRHISLCGRVHNVILAVVIFDRQYNSFVKKSHSEIQVVKIRSCAIIKIYGGNMA